MREIKFKAKLSHSKQWVIGNLVIAQNGQPYIIPSEVFEPDGHHLKIDSDEPYWVDKKTISQFTGLTDKNGVEIYEGDIIRIHWRLIDDYTEEIVSFSETEYGFNYGNNSLYELNNPIQYPIEVIGNIHDK